MVSSLHPAAAMDWEVEAMAPFLDLRNLPSGGVCRESYFFYATADSVGSTDGGMC